MEDRYLDSFYLNIDASAGIDFPDTNTRYFSLPKAFPNANYLRVKSVSYYPEGLDAAAVSGLIYVKSSALSSIDTTLVAIPSVQSVYLSEVSSIGHLKRLASGLGPSIEYSLSTIAVSGTKFTGVIGLYIEVYS